MCEKLSANIAPYDIKRQRFASLFRASDVLPDQEMSSIFRSFLCAQHI